MNLFENIFKDFGEALKKIFGDVEDMILDIFEVFREVEYKEKVKVKFKPVPKIKPTKTYYRNKRIVNYYCRNNC